MKPLRIIGTVLIFLSILTFFSCDENLFTDYGDDTSDEAKYEEAMLLLDDGKFSDAKTILLTLDQSDEKVKRALASSYAGIAGLDVPSLITAIDNANNNGIETVGIVLGDSDNNNQLTGSEITSKSNDITEAINQYEGLTKTSSVEAQLCILYATRVVLTIANDLSTANSNNAVPLDTTISSYPNAGTATYSTASINNDISKINEYIDSIDSAVGGNDGNSLRSGFDQLLNDIGYSNDNNISNTELQNLVTGT